MILSYLHPFKKIKTSILVIDAHYSKFGRHKTEKKIKIPYSPPPEITTIGIFLCILLGVISPMCV